MILSIETLTKEEILQACKIDNDLLTYLGGYQLIDSRDIETLKPLVHTWFMLNNDARCHFDKFGF